MHAEGRRPGAMRATVLALAIVAAAALGCHSSVGSRAGDAGVGDGDVTLNVVNHSWLDINVYVVQGTRRDRIGTATATSTTRFHLSLRRLTSGGGYSLLADPVGSRTTMRSEQLFARDGDVVTWTLEDDLRRSTVDIR